MKIASFIIFKNLNIKFILFISLLNLVYSLYEDQVGKFDWRQQYIGKVKTSYIDPATAGTQKFIVATEENVLASLSIRTGSIRWRQVLEKGKNGSIDAISEDDDLITVNGGGQFIRSWNMNTGVLVWETSFPHKHDDDALVHFNINSQMKDIIKIEMIPQSHAKLYVYSFTRASLKTSDAITASWLNTNTQCKFISNNYFICIDSVKKYLYLLSVKDGGSFISISFASLGIEINEPLDISLVIIPYQGSSETPVFGLRLGNDIMLLRIQPPGIKVYKVLPKIDKITSTIINNNLVLFSISQNNDEYVVKAWEFESNKELDYLNGAFNLPKNDIELEQGFVMPYTKKDHGISYKLLLLLEDHSMLIIHQLGRLVWSREEALSSIISAELMDLPLSETDANIEQEFGQQDAGVILMFLNRIKSQIFLLQMYVLKTLIGFKSDSDDNKGDKTLTLTRDYFGLHKIIVVLTKPGKAFGIDTFTGLIIWSHYVKDLIPFIIDDKPYLPLFVQRTTAHVPYTPICTAFGKHRKSQLSYVYSFDPITGETIESKALPYEIIQAIPSGTVNNQYIREVLLLDSNMNVHSYPSSDASAYEKTHYIFTTNVSTGVLTGYSFIKNNQNTLKANEVWKVHLPQKIVNIAIKNPLEHVHSQGRVMGDRSVLYKYLNPNLAAVFTEGIESPQKTFCNIYLIDMITGLIVYSASHKRCRRPLNVVHSENWVVYSYYNDKSRRIEMSSLELFEGMSQSNTTAFSSFAPPPLPMIEHQTYIFPSVIEAMANTITERGMTSRHLLIALPSGGILELPKHFLDPRRPINPLPEHREEGLIPYIPELPIMAEGIINYNQSIMRVRGIQTAPSGLESTCLVFVYGLDLFYTRVTPSKTFDILKDDFDHYLISVVLLGLLVLSYTTKKLAARKTLRAAWK